MLAGVDGGLPVWLHAWMMACLDCGMPAWWYAWILACLDDACLDVMPGGVIFL